MELVESCRPGEPDNGERAMQSCKALLSELGLVLACTQWPRKNVAARLPGEARHWFVKVNRSMKHAFVP